MNSSSSPIELTILTVEPQDSYVQDLVGHYVWPTEGLFVSLYIHDAASQVHVEKKTLSFPVSFNLVKVQD